MTRKWRLVRQLALVLSVAASMGWASGSASGQEQRGLLACYGLVTHGRESPDIQLMQVTTPAKRLPFYQNRTVKTPHCPAEVDQCQLKSFVVPGDLVLAGPEADGFACASYISPGIRRVRKQFRETIGFLPMAELKVVKTDAPDVSDWFGTWHRSAEAEIWIDRYIPGKVKIGGWATYGALDPERVKRGAVNTGDLDDIVESPKGNMLAIGEGYDGSKPFGEDRSECRAKLRLLGPYLVVEDNGGCGGNNVSFTGTYVRVKNP